MAKLKVLNEGELEKLDGNTGVTSEKVEEDN